MTYTEVINRGQHKIIDVTLTAYLTNDRSLLEILLLLKKVQQRLRDTECHFVTISLERVGS